ncbi:unnamed protein product, partial [Durusdinium trenchii]
MSIAAPKTNEIENSSFLYHQHPQFAAGVDNLSLLLGEPTSLFSRTDDGTWQPMETVSPKPFAFQHPVDLCWVYPTNDSTQWLGTEDHTWHRAPKSLPRKVKTFIHQVVAEKHGKLVDIMEIYSPPRVTKEARKQNAQGRQPQLRLGQALDLRTGWDFTKRAHRREAIKLAKKFKPALLVLSPPCTTFSTLRRLSDYKRDFDTVEQERREGLMHWHFCLYLARLQHDARRGFLLEHPRYAESWKDEAVEHLMLLPGVFHIYVDMCAFQLYTVHRWWTSQEANSFADQHLALGRGIDYVHVSQAPMNLPDELQSKANYYAKSMAQPVADYIQEEPSFQYDLYFVDYHFTAFPAKHEIRPLAESGEVQELAQDLSQTRSTSSLAPDLRREVSRLHRNLGHPAQDSFFRALKHANVKPEVLDYVKRHFTCPICLQHQKPKTPRPGHLAHALRFNEIVGVDVLFVEFGGNLHAFLNMVCWGTGLQNVTYLPQKSAAHTMLALTDSLLMPYGPPTLIIADQGTEFTGREFGDKLNQMGIMVHYIDTHAPWQAGFTPYQRAFGYSPRLPASLLSDDLLGPLLVSASATDDVQRSWQIRDMASQAWMRSLDEDSVKRALKTPTRTADQSTLVAGDWCYVWRSTRWSGPGVIVAVSPNQRTTWISLRGALLKVSREHVRPTTTEEDLGRALCKELSLEMLKDIKHGRLSRYHDLFLDARIKEVQSLIDNKAIKILSPEESRAFRRDHPVVYCQVLVQECGYRINSYDRCVFTVLFELYSEHERKETCWDQFGKAVNLQEEKTGTGYAGRRLRQLPDYSFELTMADYIKNRLKPVEFKRKFLVKNSKSIKLTEDEESALRGTVNKVVARLKAVDVTIRIHPIKENDIRHVLISDSSFDPKGFTKPQHGRLQGISTPQLNKGELAPISLIAWKSRRLRRKAGSSNLCESVSLATAFGGLEKQIATLNSFLKSRYDV